MISFAKGVLAAKLSDAAIIEVGGLGYHVGMSANSVAALPEVGQPVQVHTHLQVREDALTLFGFVSIEEKELFERLLGVSGVGPKVALAALSSFSPEQLSNAIVAGDVTAVSRIPGVGKKTAQRIILELQGVLAQPAEAPKAAAASGAYQSAVEDLLAMGFTSAESELALKGAPQDLSETKLLQYALKRLGA
ncbi:ATP-dependent DNA helicase RuvA [Denitrobacterium detoxificans]|uniref:Holliday junction branch migration complex subunit RuvA n=1 Tax=Denitrobacterium detoxificans TaxID=79604 RepID=A0A172RWF4_9ACTN|nr:Holliday junction branch migration protein RuvA [Denitrobacterium detoxificans]ANE21985.1 ATP-dependent DNA helicase RuvA [Denitrobacterium detoxificans]SEO98137.1 Holliday junction DNA helicase subunit RuvA [Denitrobacterium detoxificans]